MIKTWNEFIEADKYGKINVWIDRDRAISFLKSPLSPPHYRTIFKAVDLIFFLSTIGTLVLFWFLDWWQPITIFICLVICYRAFKNEASRIIKDICVSDARLFQIIVENNLMSWQDK